MPDELKAVLDRLQEINVDVVSFSFVNDTYLRLILSNDYVVFVYYTPLEDCTHYDLSIYYKTSLSYYIKPDDIADLDFVEAIGVIAEISELEEDELADRGSN